MNTNKLVTELEDRVFSLLAGIDTLGNPWSPDQTASAISILLHQMQELQARNDYVPSTPEN